ncbi:NTP transferase domain-containing protein [Candidatus Saccharibacteria bacterium TM7i]|nr:NTP transferase domain-containing protein [Candidatus Saccharibacteria bacterium TM7i]
MIIQKALIPVAGWGTRMLPITKAVEKCMLPIGTRPVIDYVVQDVIAAGITDIYFVVAEGSTQIQQYYSANETLNRYLTRNNKTEKLSLVAPPQNITFHYITQPSEGGYGTSIPVGLASDHIEEGESVLVIMGDQFFLRDDNGSNAADLIQQVEASGASSGLLGVPIPEEDVSKYGIIEKDAANRFVQIVEKPAPEDAPSNLNNASFYLFDKKIFELAKTLPANPVRGEFEITDAINTYVEQGGTIMVGEAKGQYLDAGSPDGWLHANNVVAQK